VFLSAVQPADTFQQPQCSGEGGRLRSAGPGSLRMLPGDRHIHCTYRKCTHRLYTWVIFSPILLPGHFNSYRD